MPEVAIVGIITGLLIALIFKDSDKPTATSQEEKQTIQQIVQVDTPKPQAQPPTRNIIINVNTPDELYDGDYVVYTQPRRLPKQ